jgi:hypothetical protein
MISMDKKVKDSSIGTFRKLQKLGLTQCNFRWVSKKRYPSFLLHYFNPSNPPTSMKIGKQMTDQNKITPINCHTFILIRDPPYVFNL